MESVNVAPVRTSYTNTVDYGDVIEAVTAAVAPRRIVEIGILDGFSLDCFCSAAPGATVEAYDIFEDFDGNHPDRAALEARFGGRAGLSINWGDFYKLHESLGEADLIHIDIANDGDVFKFALEHYLPKVRAGGVLLLEGGSVARDGVAWMKEYDKLPIAPVVAEHGLSVIGEHPSVTVVPGQR